jgi:LysR family glycine cleavage system transcriptional activator
MDRSGLPTLSTLRAFEAAARHASFSAAGRELNVTHAAISQQVRRLEAELGLALVRRAGRGLALTPVGAELGRRLTEGLDVMRAAVAEALQDQARRPLQVTMTPIFAVSWMMPRIGRFRAELPGIELMIYPSPWMVDIVLTGYDLAIRYGSGDWPGLECEPFVPTNFVVVATPDLVAGRHIREPADLKDLPWVQEFGTDELTLWLRRKGVTVEGKTDVAHLPGYMLQAALRRGEGVGCTTRVFVEEDVAAGDLVVLFEDEGDFGTGYHLVRPRGEMRPPLASLVTWLKREAASAGAPA